MRSCLPHTTKGIASPAIGTNKLCASIFWASTNFFLLENAPPFRSFSAETLIQKFFPSGTSPPSPFSPIFHAKLPHNPEGCVIEFTRIDRASQPSDSIGKLRSKIWR